MSTFAIAEPSFNHLMLSSRLISELGPSTEHPTNDHRA